MLFWQSMISSVTQEDPAGCAIACVAAVLRTSYRSAKRLFECPEHASSRGFYCREIVHALNKKQAGYTFSKVSEKNKQLLKEMGCTVFIEKSRKYPLGHFLVKTKKGWMNPWINFPSITPAQSGFQQKLPGKPKWVIENFGVNTPAFRPKFSISKTRLSRRGA